MNLIRTLMSLFLLVVLGLSMAGWGWAASQPSPKRERARAVLAVCGAMAVGAIGLLWSAKQRQMVE